MKLRLVACLRMWLLVALPLASLSAANAQSASSVPRPEVPASAASGLPVLAREPEAGHLRPGEQVLVDDGRCPSGQIKEVTGGTNRQCDQGSALLDTSPCKPVTGAKRTYRCVARP